MKAIAEKSGAYEKSGVYDAGVSHIAWHPWDTFHQHGSLVLQSPSKIWDGGLLPRTRVNVSIKVTE